MNGFVPTEEQLRIIRSDAPRIVVSAGAGTGKTATLAARYVRLVEDGLSPRNILCVTFTRKAAAEMKERIVGVLVERNLLAAAQEAETGPIQTMHSFYERTLGENAIAAGLDPGFRLAEDDETESLLASVARETLLPETADAARAELARELLQPAPPKWSGRDRVVDIARTVIGGWARSGLDPERVRRELARDRWAALERRTILESQPPELRAALEEEGAGADLLAAARAFLANFPRGEAAKHARELIRTLEEDDSVRNRLLAQAAVEWIADAWTLLRQEEERTSVYSMDSLESRAVNVLRSFPVVAARLRRRYRHVMVDESQDMNPLRHAFLGALNPANLLQVGDGQQSIYLFLGADREEFLRAQRADAGERWERHSLTLNRRSSLPILNLVEIAFRARWGDDFLAMEAARPEAAAAPPDPSDPFSNPAPPPSVLTIRAPAAGGTLRGIECLLSEGFRPNEIAVLWNAYDASLLTALDRAAVPYRVVGGNRRLWLKRESRDLANALSAIADPADRLSLLATLRSPIGGLSMAAVFRLAKAPDPLGDNETGDWAPADAEAWRAFRAWFDPLERLAHHLPAWEVLARVIADSPFLANLAREEGREQALANARKLLADAARRPNDGLPELAQRLRAAKRSRIAAPEATVHEEGAPLVTVITVHKAKGLEWPAVVVHHAGKKARTFSADAYVQPGGAAFAIRCGDRSGALYGALKKAQDRREAEERDRLDYVAATRARDRLVLIVDGQRRVLLDAAAKMPAHAVRHLTGQG